MSDVISAFTAGRGISSEGPLAILEEKYTLRIQSTKKRGRRKDRGKEKNSKWSLTFSYQAQSPEPGTHISKLCRQPNFLMKRSFPVCQFGFFPHLQRMKCKCWGELGGNLSHEWGRENHRERHTEKRQESIPRARPGEHRERHTEKRQESIPRVRPWRTTKVHETRQESIPRARPGEPQRKVHVEVSGWGFPPLTWPRDHVKASEETQESACLRKMLSCTSGSESTTVERHLLVVKPPLRKNVRAMTSSILSPFLLDAFAKWAQFFLRLFLKEMYFNFDKLKKLIKSFI